MPPSLLRPSLQTPYVRDQRSFDQARTIVARIVADGHDRPSLVAEIACDIGAEILEGVRRPGEDLNSVDLSARYKTSRTPVREALMLLEKEGLVEVPPRRRPRVLLFDIKDVREIYRVRASLLELVAGDVARVITETQLGQLSEITGRMRDAMERADLSDYIWGTVAFHDLNTRIADNQTAKRIIDSLLLRTIPMRRLSLAHGNRMRESLADHEHLVQAYERRDAVLASALIRSNHVNALAALERSLTG